MIRRSSLLPLLTAFALAFFTTACDSVGGDDDDVDGNGSFSATVSGEANANFDGQAFFLSADDIEDEEEGFAIGMLDISEGDTSMVVLGREATARPGETDYSISSVPTDGDFPEGGAFYSFVVSQQNGLFAASESGTLSITTSENDQLSGDFSFTAIGVFGGQQEVEVEGSFDAVQGTPEDFELEGAISLRKGITGPSVSHGQ